MILHSPTKKDPSLATPPLRFFFDSTTAFYIFLGQHRRVSVKSTCIVGNIAAFVVGNIDLKRHKTTVVHAVISAQQVRNEFCVYFHRIGAFRAEKCFG